MKSELDNLGFKDIEDYGDMEWGTFKIEHPEKLESVLNARAKVLMAFSLKEDRLLGQIQISGQPGVPAVVEIER
ncbi:hypothetical protein WJX77_007444 [Trebouxia sp. C0004]